MERNRQRNVIIAYTNFLKLQKLTWEPPRYTVEQKFPFIPNETEIDALITAAPRKISTFLLLIKETAMRRGECKRLLWTGIDVDRNTITLNNPEKHSKPRMWKVTTQLICQLNALPKTSDRVFGDCKMDSIKSAFLKLRQKQAAKLQNPRLLKIGFHTIRHWKATMLYHQTKDPLYVRDFLGQAGDRIIATEPARRTPRHDSSAGQGIRPGRRCADDDGPGPGCNGSRLPASIHSQ